MSTVKSPTVQIEFDLPRDVLFAMKSFGRPEVIRQKVRTALALLLFRENAVSLGKAADVAEMSYATSAA
ncbi:MAG: hypothetical protein D3906_18270, partial [Candidatus Electrothrix sp. AUS1_2]|nr:hypothetical protein [Candidatus Electrothrix sp. AUS1_2]